MGIEKKAYESIKKYGMLSEGERVVIGLSGGADSVALLKVMCAMRDRYSLKLRAAHVNHMIRGNEAKRDAEYARQIAEACNVEFHLLECDVPALAKKRRISEEMAGRDVRYEFFEKIAEGGKIAVAHHMGDSAETTIINMIRGSSLKGLKGISPVNGNIIRPLIECEREEIEEYLKDKNIPFMTDSTNYEDIYTRNTVRNTIIPQMQKINPSVVATIYENSRLLAEDEDFISSVCLKRAGECITEEKGKIVLDFEKSESLHIAVKSRLILMCCERLKGNRKGISSANIDSVLSLPTGGRASFGGICAERCYSKIIFSDTYESTDSFYYEISIPGKAVITETGKTYTFCIEDFSELKNYEKGCIYLDAGRLGKLTLRSRRPGDIFSPLGMRGRKKVKDYLIDGKIPRHERDRMAVLESDGKIAAILCHRADEAYKVTKETSKILKISEETI